MEHDRLTKKSTNWSLPATPTGAAFTGCNDVRSGSKYALKRIFFTIAVPRVGGDLASKPSREGHDMFGNSVPKNATVIPLRKIRMRVTDECIFT